MKHIENRVSPDWLNLQVIRDFAMVGGRKVVAFDELSSEIEESEQLLLVSGVGDGAARRRSKEGKGGVVKRVEDCGRERR